MLKRSFDLLTGALLIVALAPLFVACALAVRLSSQGPVFFASRRIGRNGVHFKMWKFRSMREGTPQLATHLVKNPSAFLTPVGGFLRNTSLDELPQLWNVLRGEMSLVGPRPALFNQDDLIDLRRLSGVEGLRPGVTGWAQVKGRDALSSAQKAALDEYYLQNRSFLLDLRILMLTGFKVLKSEGIKH